MPDGNLYADALHYGMFAFAIDGLPVNPQSPATVQVTVYLPEAAPALSGWYKFDQANGRVTDYSAYSSVQNGHLVLSLVERRLGRSGRRRQRRHHRSQWSGNRGRAAAASATSAAG